MDDATARPQRMRYSFEARCRAVAMMDAGVSPGAAAHTVGASRATGYRWWRRYTTAGWAGLHERPSTPQRQPRRLSPRAEAEILAARRGPMATGSGAARQVNRLLNEMCPPRPQKRCGTSDIRSGPWQDGVTSAVGLFRRSSKQRRPKVR